MFSLCANKVKLTVLTRETLAAGASGIFACQFDLSADWDGLTVRAVFRAGGAEKPADVVDGLCTIPWEVLREEGETLSVGLYGENAEQEIVLPTLWADLGKIWDAADLEGVTLPPTPSLAEQALEEIRKSEANAAKYAEEAKKAAEEAAGNAGSGGLNITDDGDGNVSISSTGSVSITDDGAGNVTIR